MNKIENIFGIALRQNVDNYVHQLKVAIVAALYHSSNFTKTENCDQFLPITLDSWCSYWKYPDKYQKKQGFSLLIYQLIKSIFLDLNNETLLAKSFHGKTQNSN